MKMIDIKKVFRCGVVALATLATACVVEETTPFEGSELGALQKVYEVESIADMLHVDVYSNNTYTISLLNDADWVSFPATSSGDKGFDEVTHIDVATLVDEGCGGVLYYAGSI